MPLFFKDQGSGPVLVFLHGFCETHEIWQNFTPPFTSSFRVITPDLPGFGSSEILSPPFTIDQVGNAVAELLVQNNISKAIIIGHSLGGYVALSLLQNHPKLIRGLGLFHSSAFADSEEKKLNRDKIIEFVKKNGVQPFIDTFVPGLFFDKKNADLEKVYKIASLTRSEALISYTKAMRDRPDRQLLWAKNEIPKLLIAGVADTSVPIQISREMFRIGLNVTFAEMESTGHMGFFESKNECELAIKRFTYEVFFNN